jgi:hypothetical protein
MAEAEPSRADFQSRDCRQANIDLYNLRKNGVFIDAKPFEAVTVDSVWGEPSNTFAVKDEYAQGKAKGLDREVWGGL